MVLKFLIEKEFKQLIRNPFMPKLIFIFPMMIMFIMPWAATLDVKNIKVVVVDNDRSSLSERFSDKIARSTYFNFKGTAQSYNDGIAELEYGRADLVLEIPAGFENDLVNLGTTPIQISINAVNSIKGNFGQVYMSALAAEFSEEYAGTSNAMLTAAMPKVNISVLNMHNPYLDYKFTMIPGLMMIIVLMLCGFLPAVNIVSEKEVGTIEQINVTPVGKFTFIIAKLIPYWLVGLVALSLGFVIAWALYGLTPAGSLLTIYFFAMLFILTMTGAGLVVSNHSSTMQQSIFVMFFFVIIFVMMSGLLTPVQSMPTWAQAISAATPTKYFVDVMRDVYLKGSTIADLWVQALALSGMAILLNTWAVRSYRKFN
jgi:ABC-2 type transport system permease protein